MAERIIAACGNDCAQCPRYVRAPYGKSASQLTRTAELWYQIGYRDRVVSVDEIACMGCTPDNWCRYQVVKCVRERHIDHCGQCVDYPCSNISKCFAVTHSFEPRCRQVCTPEEYETMRRAFFEKEQNLTTK